MSRHTQPDSYRVDWVSYYFLKLKNKDFFRAKNACYRINIPVLTNHERSPLATRNSQPATKLHCLLKFFAIVLAQLLYR